VVLLATAYVAVFIIPTNMQFSYASQETCIERITLAPGLHNQRAGTDDFTIELKDTVNLFGSPIFSRSVCVSANDNAPTEGRIKVSVAPFGLPIFSKTYGVNTPATPVAQVAELRNTEISAVRTLVVPFSQKDVIHSYTLRQGQEEAECEPVDEGVSCTVSQLGLVPSTPYELALYRGYKEDAPAVLEKIPVKTLTAVELVDRTVSPDQTIYDKPIDFRFVFDRELESVKGELVRTDGEGSNVTATFKVEDTTVIVTPGQVLARSAEYRLTLQEVTGIDGGSLVDPIVTPFKASGGPKVTGVSVGATAIPQNTQITVTFDQPIKADSDITKFAASEGIALAVRRTSDTTIAYTVASAPLCAAFTLTIDKGLPSGSNDGVSTEAWRFDGRIICGSSAVIGYSVQGRALIAYTFGSGNSTILYTGGIHGTEPSSVTTMEAWVTYLQSNAYILPADKKVVIVPNTNPDGIAAGSRNNVNNVNLDRNYPSDNWRPDIDTASGILPTGGGSAAGSEPETQALMALTRQLRPRLEVSFHAQGSLVGANQYGDSTAIGTAYARMVGYGTMIGNAEEVMGYSITGEYEDWMGQEMGIPAILIELPRLSGNYLQSQLNALIYTLKV
jgi:protein MpaA